MGHSEQMFNSVESSSVLKKVMEARLTDTASSDVILDAFMAEHDFGQGFFHKILTKSVLNPGSIMPQEDTLAS